MPGGARDYWCLLPVRAALICNIEASDHIKSRAGSNQMDPFHYIHLPGTRCDIRVSQIGLFVRSNGSTTGNGMTFVVVNLMDGRLRGLIEEPLLRLREALKRRLATGKAATPRLIFLVYVSSALRWWNTALLSFNNQLIMHVRSPVSRREKSLRISIPRYCHPNKTFFRLQEKQLQQEIANETSAFSERSKDINTALHIMAAHLHRYRSELQRVDFILTELLSSHFDTQLGTRIDPALPGPSASPENDRLKVEQLISQLKAITVFAGEMESKIQNILTLVRSKLPSPGAFGAASVLMPDDYLALQPNSGHQRQDATGNSAGGPGGHEAVSENSSAVQRTHHQHEE